MKVPRLKGLAAAAVALATLALPLQAMADSHRADGPDRARCNQIQQVDGQFGWLARQYPQLQQWLMQCQGMSGPATPIPPLTPSASQPPAPAPQLVSFSDLGGYSWAQGDINLLQSMGIMQGFGHGIFRPGGILTRVQFAALLQRVFHLTVPSNPISFVDVTTGYWGYNAVESAAPYMGEFQTPGGLAFEPSLPMLRIDVAASIGKILVTEGLAQLPSASQVQTIWGGFADGSQVPAGLAQYAAVAVQSGIMVGMANGSFGVDDTLNRAEAAVLLTRVLEGTETMPGGTGTIGTTTYVTGTVTSATATSVQLSNGTTYQAASGETLNLAVNESVTLTLNAQSQVIGYIINNNSTTTVTGTVTSTTATSVQLDNGTTYYAASGETLNLAVNESVTLNLNSSMQVVSYTINSSTTTVTGTVTSTTGTSVQLNNGTTYYAASGETLNLAVNDSVTLTLNSSQQVTSYTINSSGPVATSFLNGYIVSASASNVVVAVYSSGASITTYGLDSGATITLNGQAVSAASLPLGDYAQIGIDSTAHVASIAATTPSGQLTGYALESVNGSNVATLSDGQLVSLGSAPVVFNNGGQSTLTALYGQSVTIDPGVMGGSALVVH